jgi:hypothetical protein
LAEAVWFDGTPRPERSEGTETFEWKEYKTQRYHYGFNLGDKAINQASWDLLETHSRITAQRAMTARTQLAVNEITNASLYDATHTSAVASIPGNTGNLGQSTTQRQDIKRSFNYSANIIKKDTLSAVKTDALIIVMSPETAIEISEAQEFVDHVKHSDHALAQVRGSLPGRNHEFGLPDHLYGFEIVVEDAVKVATHKGATTTKDYVLPKETPVMLSRPGDLVAVGQGPSFSTCMLFAYEELTVETLRQEDHRRQLGSVVDDIDLVLTSPVSGFLFTAAV